MKEKEEEHIYSLELTKRQAQILSYACDQFSRLICGQDLSFQNLMEEAWEKRSKDATGDSIDKDFEGGWYDMRRDAERICKEIKKKFWNMPSNAHYGVHYDDTADILFDIHQVIRHQLWLDQPCDQKLTFTVDASKAMKSGSSILAKINKINKKH